MLLISLLTANEKNSVTAIDVTGDISSVTADSLRGFDVTVAAPGIPADNAIVGVLKDAMPWTPCSTSMPASIRHGATERHRP